MIYCRGKWRRTVGIDEPSVVLSGFFPKMFQSLFDQSVRFDVVVLRVDRNTIIHGQLDRVSHVQQKRIGDQKSRGLGQTIGDQIRLRPRTIDCQFLRGRNEYTAKTFDLNSTCFNVNIVSNVELGRESIPENVERNGDVRRHGDDVR